MIKAITKKRLIQLIFTVVLLLGLILRFYQYLMGRSLWDDETHLALNFMNHGFLRLLQPLDYIQAAPALFILSVKAIVEIFGYSEIAFRAFPFITSIATLPLIYFITRDLTGNKIMALIAFFVFSVNLCVIYFSSELKQYTVELAVYLVMVYLATGKNEFVADRRALLLTLAGSISMFLSSTAFIILFCIACNYFLNWYEQKKINKQELKIFIPWLLAFFINYFLFIHNHPATAQQRTNYSFAFCPTNLLSCEFVTFLKTTIEETFFTLVLYISKDWGFAYILFLIFFVAIRHIILRKQRLLFFLVCLPILLHLGLSALKLYPFWYRLILYLVPCFIILMALGTGLIADFLKRKLHVLVAVAAIFYGLYFFTKESFKQFPLWYREIKPALNYVNNSLPATAHVYITDPAHAYTYYYQRGYVHNKIYKEVPWEIELPEFYDIVYEEKSNYLFFYGTYFQWGYKKVLDDLKKKGLIVRTFQYKGYAVSEVRPAERDTGWIYRLDYTYFDPAVLFEEDKSVAIWSDSIRSKPFFLKAGKYQISILARGTSANGTFPRNRLFIDDRLVGDFNSYQKYQPSEFSFETNKDLNAVFKIIMLNDTVTKNEDRNSFIKSISVHKANK